MDNLISAKKTKKTQYRKTGNNFTRKKSLQNKKSILYLEQKLKLLVRVICKILNCSNKKNNCFTIFCL